jgi:hypothetical protein
MPEVRLAWRATLCGGAPEGQVVVGVAPSTELEAIGEVVPPQSLRRYSLGDARDPAAENPPAWWLGAGAETLTLVVLDPERPFGEMPWDALVTVAIHGEQQLARYFKALSHCHGHGEAAFIASIGVPPESERRLFESIRDTCTSGDPLELRRQVSEVCARTAGGR